MQLSVIIRVEAVGFSKEIVLEESRRDRTMVRKLEGVLRNDIVTDRVFGPSSILQCQAQRLFC